MFRDGEFRFAEQELIGNAVRIGNSNRCCMSLPCAGRSVLLQGQKVLKFMSLAPLSSGRL